MYRFVIIEHYPDGGVWRHWHQTLKDAEQAVEALREAHRARRYEIVNLDDLG